MKAGGLGLRLTLVSWMLATGCTSTRKSDPPVVIAPAAKPGVWPSAGHDNDNTRSQPLETRIGPNNVGRLGIKWFFLTEGDVWATPAVDETTVYVPDSLGNLFAVDRQTGSLV